MKRIPASNRGGVGFQFRPYGRLFGVTPFSSSKQISEYLKLDDHFLPHPFQFTTHWPSSQSTLAYNIGVKRDLSLDKIISWFQPAFHNNINNKHDHVIPINQFSTLNVGYHIVVSHVRRNHVMNVNWKLDIRCGRVVLSTSAAWQLVLRGLREPRTVSGVWRRKLGSVPSENQPSNYIVVIPRAVSSRIPKIHRCPQLSPIRNLRSYVPIM